MAAFPNLLTPETPGETDYYEQSNGTEDMLFTKHNNLTSTEDLSYGHAGNMAECVNGSY